MEKQDAVYKEGLSLLTICLIFVLIASLAFAGYLYFQKSKIQKTYAEKQTELTTLNTQIESLNNQKISYIVNSNELKKRLVDEIRWSKVIENLNKITPKEVFYRSYSGNKSGEIFLSSISKDLPTITKLIDVLVSKDYLSKVFVPSISKGTSSSGTTQYTFSLKLNYANVAE